VVFIPLERILLGGVGFQEIEKLLIIIYFNSMRKPSLLVDWIKKTLETKICDQHVLGT
jgi:hypothetical protein